MFTLLSTSAYTAIHEWKTAAVKKLKCKVLYFSYKQNFYKIYMHYIYIKEKLKNISYTF